MFIQIQSFRNTTNETKSKDLFYYLNIVTSVLLYMRMLYNISSLYIFVHLNFL